MAHAENSGVEMVKQINHFKLITIGDGNVGIPALLAGVVRDEFTDIEGQSVDYSDRVIGG